MKKDFSKDDIIEILSDYIFNEKMSDAPELLDMELNEAKLEADKFVNEYLNKFK